MVSASVACILGIRQLLADSVEMIVPSLFPLLPVLLLPLRNNIQFFEKFIEKNTLDEFKKQINSDKWLGPESDTSLFHIWRKMRNSVIDSTPSLDSTIPSQLDFIGIDMNMLVIPGVLKASVWPRKGTLQPEDVHMSCLTVTSLGSPVLLTFPLSCELLNLTERRRYEKSVRLDKCMSERLQGEFVITKDCVSFPASATPATRITTVESQVKLEKPPTILHVVLTVTCYVSSVDHIDIKLSLRDQLRTTPSSELLSLKMGHPRAQLAPLEVQGRGRGKGIQFTLYCCHWTERNTVHTILLPLDREEHSSHYTAATGQRGTQFTLYIDAAGPGVNLLHGKRFQQTMVERSHEPPLYYRQLTMTRKQRCELTSQLDTIPPHFLAERILNDIIFQAIREKCGGMSLEDARLTPGTTGTYRATNISLTPPYSELQREFDYEIQRDPATNPLGHVFDVEPYRATVPPGQNFVFKVKFAPKFPSAVCVDYFTVLGPDGVKLILTVRGCSEGPSVQTSTHKMVFVCLGGKTSASNILVLNNESDVPAAFQFDVDKTQSVFQVGETTGTLKPRGALYVTVKFVPLSPGIFVQKLACLVLYQVAVLEPLLIEAVGVRSDSENISPERLSLTSHWEHCPLEGSYERYMDDCSRVAKNTPELSLSEAYLDFGQAEVGTTDAPLAFSLTSHVDDDIILEWDQGSSVKCELCSSLSSDSSVKCELCSSLSNISSVVCELCSSLSSDSSVKSELGSAGYVPDKNKVFHIDPPSTLVPAWRSVLFQVYFRPHTTDLLYSAKLEGRAYRGTHETRQKMEFPLETWISVMDVPFDSVPSNYTVKPSQGVIDTDYQIVVVQLCPESLQETAYVERWGLEFNKSPDQEVDVPFDSVPSNYTVKPSQGVIDTDYQIVVVQLCPESLQETAYVERWGLEFNKSPDQEVGNPLLGEGVTSSVIV
uniref:CFAP65 fourth Ig-like domain-containing protein n=1 Tax=Timema cristinae TaxID=61476 RepID=A0A7R9CTZ4_TIMCR|nr:unnamed protein product [Timema cristinae]